MQNKGKGSTASPPAGHNRGQQSSQRGPTPPQPRQDDYSQRNNQGYPQQPMNVQPTMQMYPGMVAQQGQPPRMPGQGYYRPMTRPMRIPPQAQTNQNIYPSPTGGGQIIPIPGGGQPYGIPQQYVSQQVDYPQVPVGSPQMQFRGPPPPMNTGYIPQQMNFQAYSPTMAQAMPFVPQGQGPPFMYLRTQMPQNMGGQPYQPVRQEQQQTRKKKIIKIKDPNQDNKDVTDEILSSAAHSHSTNTAEGYSSGRSSNSNTPPVNSHDPESPAVKFQQQAAATLREDKPKVPAPAQPIQVAKNPSQQKTNFEGIKIISIEKNASRAQKDTKEKEKTEVETVKDQPKPEETPLVTNADQKKEGTLDATKETKDEQQKTEPKEEKKDIECKPVEATVVQSETTDEIKKEVPKELPKAECVSSTETKTIEKVPNGSISPNEEIIKPQEIKQVEMAPPVEEQNTKSDIKTVNKLEETEEQIVESKSETVESSEQKVPVETSVNGIENDSKPKAAPAVSTTTEQVKKKKSKTRFKDFDKKPESDLMDAYREAPAKLEVKEEPEEPKEQPKEETQEEKEQSEEETWEDKDELDTDDLKEGPRFYDRDFLLQFQFNPICTAKPEGLPDIEVVLNTMNTMNSRQPPKQNYQNRMGGGNVDFMPSYMRPAGRQSQSNTPRGNKRAPSKKIVHTIEQKVELIKTENRWVRPTEAEKALDEEEKKRLETIRKFRGILNKLTPQKFNTLIQQILELEIDTPEKLEEIINITFEKAITEPAFSVAYANMCRCLIPKNVKVTQDGKDQTLTFRKILLNKCQKEFEKEKDDEQSIHTKMEDLLKQGLSEEELKVKKDELALEELLGRRRTLGNIRFIGELFKLKMLTESIMHDCIIKLIKNNEEESYECLCKLLSTIGKDLDHQKAKPRMDQYFEQIKKVIDLKKTSSRCRFMLQDVVDLRSNNWVPRRDENNPKTIDQIHKEVAEQEKKTIMAIQQSRQQKRETSNKGRDSPRPTVVPQADETWTTVPGRTRNVNVDPKKFQDVKKRTNVDTESISLGPGGRGLGAWARGSSGGVLPASMPGAQTSEQEPKGNRFSALGGDGRRGPGNTRQGAGAGRQESRNQATTGRRPPQNDRERALEAARSFAQPKSQGKTEDRDTGSPRLEDMEEDRQASTPQSTSPPLKQLSDEEIQHKAVGLADEFFDIKDLQEAKACVEELDPSTHKQLVYHCLNHCLEKHSSERLAIAKMMFYLCKNGAISEQNYVDGLKQLLEIAEEMEIDIPHVWKYFGELIGPLILDNVLPLKLLNECITSLVQSKSKQAKLLAEILLSAAKESNPSEVGSVWSQSGLSFNIFFSSNEEAQQFIKDKNLESIVNSPPKASNKLQELSNLIVANKATNEEVFKWIDSNISDRKDPKFIRAIVTAVCQACRNGGSSGPEDSCDRNTFSKKVPLLKIYIDDNRHLELQALFALQTLAVQLDHPPDFLKSYFNALYDEDVIPEEAFFAWEEDKSPSESQGKGTASSSTKAFFEWLRSAEEETKEEG